MLFPQTRVNQYQKSLELKAVIFAIIAVIIFTVVGLVSIQFENAPDRPQYHASSLRGLLSSIAGKNITIE